MLNTHKITFSYSRTAAADRRRAQRFGAGADICDAGSSGVHGLESAGFCTGPGAAAGANLWAEPGAAGTKRKQGGNFRKLLTYNFSFRSAHTAPS